MEGSAWSKWDLHVHTPASFYHNYAGDDQWERWIVDVEGLPSDIKVIGINDYLTIDGYERVVREHADGRMPNIKLFFPVVELRIPQFGGSNSKLSKINYHVLFSPDLPTITIKNQFLNGLYTHFSLSTDLKSESESVEWGGGPSIEALTEFGRKIKSTVPQDKIAEYGSDLEEGFNNFCVTLDSIKEILSRYDFKDKYLTGVGKTEWQDIKWNEQSIASKKHVINSADFVFTAAANVIDAQKSIDALRKSSVNSNLLDCSDAHCFSCDADKDRLGNCNSWIKADPTFEGLRQSLIEYETRTAIHELKPSPPPLRVSQLHINLPEDTVITDVEVKKSKQKNLLFCFRGKYDIRFSPYFTCLIGGRGVGKSTLINLLQEAATPGENDFFGSNKLHSDSTKFELSDSLNFDATCPGRSVEFILQNQIEDLASDSDRLTHAIFNRLLKSEGADELLSVIDELAAVRAQIDEVIQAREDLSVIQNKQADLSEDLKSLNSLVSTVKEKGFSIPQQELAQYTKDAKELSGWKDSFEVFVIEMQELLDKHLHEFSDEPIEFEADFKKLFLDIKRLVDASKKAQSVGEGKISELNSKIDSTKQKISEFLALKGLSVENLRELNSATSKIAEIELKVIELNRKKDQLTLKIDGFKADETRLDKYVELVTSLIDPLNEKLLSLGAEVKPIEMEFSYDDEKINSPLFNFIANKADLRIDWVEKAFAEIEWQDVLNGRATYPANKTGRKLRELFEDVNEVEILKLMHCRSRLEVEELGEIAVRYDGKDVINTSFGQRCTAALVILLLFGNSPIVIDEPEAHLDSGLIAKYLVNLIKDVKSNRQIIFTTHNANFVVNGDSELIHVLEMSSDGISRCSPTTIENLDYREDLMGLEGGQEAFSRRERRYRKPL